MKYLSFIFILSISKLFAQLPPPDLRCLEVKGNGNVKLTWLPPADPGNLFSSFEVFFSPTKIGPYTLVSVNINAITTNTFVHVTTTGNTQGCFYYMVTRYGSGGTSTSAHSDTLKTIFFNITYVTTALDLTFNPIRTPALPSTGSAFTVLKEFPAGTWNILATTTGSAYPDTISGFCKARKISYQATLTDNSGCISVSNIQGGTHGDTKNPEQPYVDSISVLPNGNTVLAWQLPQDKDIIRYNIQYRTPTGPRVFIDSVMGRNNTLYTYTTTTANSAPVGIFVQALDSCGGSIVYYDLNTMHLKTAYNRCAYQTDLVWNQYKWTNVENRPLQELLEYRIYYSVNGSTFVRVGATTDTSFTHTNVAPGKNICYFVRAVNKTQTITSSSNRTCFFSNQVVAAGYLYLSTASILDQTRAEIKLYLDTSETSMSIDIQRSENDSLFSNVGTVTFNGTQFYTFTDNQVESDRKSYYYRAVVRDSCGNVRLASNVARTILLKVAGDHDKMFTRHLSWNEYAGFGGGVSGYNIYRIVDEGQNQLLVGSTGPQVTSYTDELEDAAPDGAKIDYLVEAVEGLGNPFGFVMQSNSNRVPVFVEGRVFVPNAFAPGGTNSTWLPVTHFVEKTEYHVAVFNRWGKKVFETSEDSVAWDGQNCPGDVYVYLIDYKNARGEYMQVKGYVSLLR